MSEVKIRLRPALNQMWDSDEVSLLTTTPQESLDEWLTAHYEPLANFRYKHGRVLNSARMGNSGVLISKTNPGLHIIIETSLVQPTDPRNVLQFGGPRQWRPSSSPKKK